ncbi:diguanylate phosphodiesterase [Bacillus freudenreichii]|nr:diguanylate phosphodiesterase [Bacillus freudenreichii]
MTCKSCLVEKVEYEVKFEEKVNHSLLAKIIMHLHRRNVDVTENQNILLLNELGVKELYDFCMDHMNPAEALFRINNQEWKPFSEIEKILEMQWVDEIIKKKLVYCHFQPIVNAQEEIFAYEILSRFNKEDGTVVYPNEAFSAAKNRGRLYALDKLCRMTAVRHAQSLKDKKAFINFIPTSIYSPEACLKSTIQTASLLGVEPSQIVFEVVETEQVEDMNHLKKILAYYQEKGFDYALDDVGEGYSTLEVLEEITPKYMKLDIQYVQGIAGDVKKQQLAGEFLHKALEVGSIPLAEGVESKEDFEWLKREGYQLFQGYLFGRPAPYPQEKIYS